MPNEAKQSLQKVMEDLESQGINMQNYQEVEGLGDKIENTLSKYGITEERVESWFGIKGCGCQKIKKFLNSVLGGLKK